MPALLHSAALPGELENHRPSGSRDSNPVYRIPNAARLPLHHIPLSGDGRNRTGYGNACRARPLLSCHPHGQAAACASRTGSGLPFHGAHTMDVSITKPVLKARRDGRSRTCISLVLETRCLSAGSSPGKRKPPREILPGTAAGKCLLDAYTATTPHRLLNRAASSDEYGCMYPARFSVCHVVMNPW